MQARRLDAMKAVTFLPITGQKTVRRTDTAAAQQITQIYIEQLLGPHALP